MRKLNFNFLIADFISQFKLGIKRRYRFIKIVKTDIALRLLYLLYKNGAIRTFVIHNDFVFIYYKFYNSRPVISNIKIISKPGRRCY